MWRGYNVCKCYFGILLDLLNSGFIHWQGRCNSFITLPQVNVCLLLALFLCGTSEPSEGAMAHNVL